MKPKIVKKPETRTKKQKSQSKRMKTFNSSEFSLWEQKNKPMQASATDLTILKQEALQKRKAQNNSAMSQYNNQKGPSARGQGLATKKKKRTRNSSKMKIKKVEQQFEKARYKESNSQSEIMFSNDETKRESDVPNITIKNVKHIESINNYHPESNMKVRGNIKKQYIRKMQAATKIQKIFRGFMTRKILLKYINEEQIKLTNRIANSQKLQFDQVRQNQTYRTFNDRDGQNLMNRLFQNYAIADIHFDHTMRPRSQNFNDMVEFAQKQSDEQPDQPSFHKQKQLIKRKQNYFENAQQQKPSPSKKQQKNSSGQASQSSGSDEDEARSMIYRRQNPIYSQQQISHYLESSSEQQQQQQELDAYEPDIIFQTNQEYIESRKSSLNNKNDTIVNKLSNKGIQDISMLVGNEDRVRKQLREDKSHQTSIKQAKNKLYLSEEKVQLKQKKSQKSETKIPEQKSGSEKEVNKSNPKTQFPLFKNIEKSNKSPSEERPSLKPTQSPRRDVRYLDEEYLFQNYHSNSSSSRSQKTKISGEQNEIVQLKEQERQKWDEIIQMVSHQIKKNQESSGQMSNFMQTIMDFSQKNKEMLASTRSFNSQSDTFTTPTSMGVDINSFGNAKSCPVNQKSTNFQQPYSGRKVDEKQQSPSKFLKKKKPLKIEIIDDNCEVENQKESITHDEPETKNEKYKIDFEKNKTFIRSGKKNLHNRELLGFSNNVNKGMRKEFQQPLNNSTNLKKFLSSNMQIQDSAVLDILKLREQLLQKRQSEQLTKLNKLLSESNLSQQQFLYSLSSLTKRFTQQKESIDKAREDITKGYQAANDLLKQYFYDVRRMGIKLAVSRSQDNLKFKLSQPLHFMGDIQVDELTPKSTPKSTPKNSAGQSVKKIFQQYEIVKQEEKVSEKEHIQQKSQSEDSSIDFTEQQLRRFRKAANYDLEFNDMNRNMATMSDQFIRQQKKCFTQEIPESKSLTQSPEAKYMSSHLQKQMYHLEDDKIPTVRTPPHIQKIVDFQIQMLICEFAAELLVRPIICQKIIDRPSFVRPLQIQIDQKLTFLKILQQNLSQKNSLHAKLNQNITPLPSEILKCMRLDFSQQGEQQNNDEDQMNETNKYEFVLGQESCVKSMMLFKQEIDRNQEQRDLAFIAKNNELKAYFENVIKGSPIREKIQKFLEQRQNFLRNKRQKTRQLRWQVLNIQLHCICDSWNEQIIQICSSKQGFSGIGLNELTLSMIDHNKSVPIERAESVIAQAKQKVVQILTDETDLNCKIQRQNLHEMYESNSAWVFYADEALSYALELVYLIEEDIYTQSCKEFNKIMLKQSLLL